MSNDIVLDDLLDKVMRESVLLKILQERIEHLWVKIATECFGWIHVYGVDLICPQRRIALVLKDVNTTEGKSGYWPTMKKMLILRERIPDYQLYYLDINNRKTEEELKQYKQDGIKTATGVDALKVLFGEDAQEVLDSIRSVISEINKINESGVEYCLPIDVAARRRKDRHPQDSV